MGRASSVKGHSPSGPLRGEPDVSISARAKVRELRFDAVPGTEVRFWGNAERDSVSGTERENLPDEVERGVEYRNAGVRLQIASRMDADAFAGGKDGDGKNEGSEE